MILRRISLNQSIRVACIDNPPFWNHCGENQKIPQSGLSFEILQETISMFFSNTTIEVSVAHEFGGCSKNGCNGIPKMLLDNHIDVGPVELGLSQSRNLYISHVMPPIMFDPQSYLVNPAPKLSMVPILGPFQTPAWHVWWASWIIMCTIVLLFSRYHVKKNTLFHKLLYDVVFQQKNKKLWKAKKVFGLITTWSLAMYFGMVQYKSHFLQLFAFDHTNTIPYQTISELTKKIKNKEHSLCLTKGTFYHNTVMRDNSTSFRALRDAYMQQKSSCSFSSFPKLVANLVSHPGLVHWGSYSLTKRVQYENCHMIVIPDREKYPEYLSLGSFAKNRTKIQDIMYRQFKYASFWLQEHGIVLKLERKHGVFLRSRLCTSQIKPKLSFRQTVRVMILYAYCIIACVIAICVEHMVCTCRQTTFVYALVSKK